MRSIFIFMTCALLTISSAYAEEETLPTQTPATEQVDNSDSERAPVKHRCLNDDDRLQLFRVQEAVTDKEESDDAQETNKPSKLGKAIQSLGAAASSKAFYSFYSGCYPASPYSVHYATEISWDSAYITLEDSSVLYVRPADQYRVAYWPVNSQVYVVPNHGYFFGMVRSSYDFCLYNASTGESVEVDIYLGPALYGPYSEWITGIDTYQGYIWLKDGSLVEVHPSDVYLTWNWASNDHLLVGVNDGSASCSYPDMILNVASVTYVRARLVY